MSSAKAGAQHRQTFATGTGLIQARNEDQGEAAQRRLCPSWRFQDRSVGQGKAAQVRLSASPLSDLPEEYYIENERECAEDNNP